MVVVFFGTPAFAVPTLEAILASTHTVAAVVTQPDRPRGRGQKTTASPVKEAAVAAGIPVLQPESVKTPELAAELSAVHADIAVVAAYGQILTQQILDTPPLGMINVHASVLPRCRGAAPVHRAIISGDRETGVTIMRMVKALDAGPMIAVERVPIGESRQRRARARARHDGAQCWSAPSTTSPPGAPETAGRCRRDLCAEARKTTAGSTGGGPRSGCKPY
jgi:methionyl-tRNA formyltransferase